MARGRSYHIGFGMDGGTAVKENTIESDILQYLRYIGFLAWRTHTGKNPPAEKGILDIGAIKQGMYVEVEVKRPGQKPSEGQKQRITDVRANGGLAFVATSVLDVQEALK